MPQNDFISLFCIPLTTRISAPSAAAHPRRRTGSGRNFTFILMDASMRKMNPKVARSICQ